ncbi:unnamed protein product [Gongylonema pulchrum]|uniref:Cytoplasmic dynein 2 heavy chain 1 n=1 Tax=Gongylonema pulchrum TaxID=637853 RepID=A0A183DN55_9BILA|nr:unnamed protein product [Gongylonema pulchrum]
MEVNFYDFEEVGIAIRRCSIHKNDTYFKVAHFYNSVDQQMLPCQQAMMLDEALAFEKLVISEKRGELTTNMASWDDPENLKEFIKKLQAAAERLTVHNRRLRKAHREICEKMKQLMNLDLLKEANKWKDIIGEIRSKLAEQEQYAGSRSNMLPWLSHWDRQLYKALQLQYQWGIESLHSQIPQIQTQLVFKDQRLQLRPPLEEIRARYYRELRKFISIPQKFRGFQDTDQANSFFAKMIERNASRFSSVFEKAEQLFEKLADIGSEFEDWVVLGQVDLEDLITTHFTRAADWENQIKLLKEKGRDAEKLPREIKLECIVVTTSDVKLTIDSILQRLFDTLIWTLRYSVSNQIHEINRFLNEAIDVLSRKSQSIDEVAEANQKHNKFAKTNKEMKQTLNLIEEKNVLLRSVGGSGAEQLPALLQLWEKFELMLDSHQLMIKEQVESLKSNVEIQMKSLSAAAEKLYARWNQFKPKNDLNEYDRNAMLGAIQFVKEKRDEFNELVQRQQQLLAECEQFDVQKTELPLIEELAKDLENYESIWLIYEEFNAGLQEMASEDWILFRTKTYRFDEFLHEWCDKLKSLPPTHITIHMLRLSGCVLHKQIRISSFQEMSTALKYCRGEALSSEHWLELFRLLGMPKGTTLERLHFGDLLNVHKAISENLEELKSLNERAQGEVTIREALQELELWAAQTEFALTDYKHSNGTTMKIIKDWKDTLNSVKDSKALLQSLETSPYYVQFRDKTSVWETRLTDTEQYLHWMNEIQRKWVYLEPIFGRGSLPSEAPRFSRVDVEFRAILNDVVRDTRIASLSSRSSLKRTLEQMIDQLNRCQRALNEFLEVYPSHFTYLLKEISSAISIVVLRFEYSAYEASCKKNFMANGVFFFRLVLCFKLWTFQEKRNAFPRFYFLGDDDLLEILGQSMNARGIHKVLFGDNGLSITAMVSAHGEVVQLSNPVRIVPQVERFNGRISDHVTLSRLIFGERFQEWLQKLSDEMRDTIRKLVVKCVREATLDPGKYPSQVLCLAEQIRFCNECERALSNVADLQSYRKRLTQALANYTSAEVTDVVLQLKLKALILDVIHNISVIDELIANVPCTKLSWAWQKQLRFYLASGERVILRHVDTQFYYTYEYQGNAAKLVHTPLTDKCYLTLTQALSMGLGGNPYGPAGTGKTESVKALANLFGRQVLVFNCDEGIDVHSMNRIFTGLVQCGAWGCFDEFNRLDESVLSAVSMQIQIIQNAIKSRSAKCSLGNREIPVDLNSAIFITLNPAGKGYGGRQKLPDNLKQLFRPIVMEMLSSQQHYDWGLRALRTVLRSCGTMLENNKDKSETQLVVDALTLNTVPKLTFDDSKRFATLIGDIFSDTEKGPVQIEELLEPLKQAANEMKLAITDTQRKKVFELFEQLQQRIGVILLGPSGTGKSTLWKVLHKAMALANRPVTTYVINPKSMPKQKLLGWMDMDTREWSDGVLTAAAREVVKDSNALAWIICDGDVDPEWIEALNSVLDDNRLVKLWFFFSGIKNTTKKFRKLSHFIFCSDLATNLSNSRDQSCLS